MTNLRVFMSERLSSAAVDIFGEVEKVVTLYRAEVSRSREEVRSLQKQLELLHRRHKGPPPSRCNGSIIMWPLAGLRLEQTVNDSRGP